VNGTKKAVRLPGPDPDWKKRGRKISLILLLFLAVLFIPDSDTIEKLPRLCIWYRLTGTDCPFCGLIRSFFALAGGSVTHATAYHPFGPVVFVAVVLFLAGALYSWITGKAFSLLAWLDRNSRKTAVILGIVWLACWLAYLLIFKSRGLE